MISRRTLLIAGTQSVLFFLAGCSNKNVTSPFFTAKLFGPDKYEESFSSVMMTEDGKKFVIFSDQYHYIFDAPPHVMQVLKSQFKQYYWAEFEDFYVSAAGEIKGTIKLGLSLKAPLEAREEALKIGFTAEGDRRFTKVAINGTRYLANGIRPPEKSIDLNKRYSLTITAEKTGQEKARNVLLTPITVAADGGLILVTAAAVVAVLPFTGLMLLLICRPGEGCAK